jgi:oxaloacetate decarboxylase alpha subunit
VKIDLDQIKVLLDMVSKTDVAELTIEIEGEKVTIKKPAPQTMVALGEGALVQHALSPVAREAQVIQVPANSGLPITKNPNPETNGGTDHLVAITSPMVGTFYRASSPTATPHAQIGDKVSVGQTVCIIEAMKLMNDLPSEVAGKVVKVCVENGQIVEYGQQLFLVDPAG